MKHTVVMLAGALLLALSVNARAESVDDIVTLAQKNVGEDVILATVDNAKGTFQLSAADIIKLKDNKVPEKVIAAMLRHKSAAPVAAPAAVPAPAVAAPAERAPAPVTIAAADGILNIENLDDRIWSYKYDPDSRTVWFSGPAADGRGNLESHGGLSVRMPPGTYKVRYSNQDNGPVITVFAGDKSLIMLSRVETSELEALYATVFERGERKATGKLVALREPRKGADNSDAPVQERIVERERVVETAPTVVYREAPSTVYSYPAYPYSYGYYSYPYPYGYSRYYGPSSSFRFGYSGRGHHSGIGVGFGF